MSLAKRIAAKRAEQERGYVEIEEWGEDGEPLRLYFMPVSARDIEQVQRKHKDFINSPTMSAMVDLIVRKCQDEKGDFAFTIEDKSILLGEPLGVIAKVFSAIFEATSVEEHEKN